MPKIINAYADGSGSIADSLKSLGQSWFGDEAKNEVYRQTGREKRRHNEAAPLAAEAFRQNNPTEMGAQFIMGDRGGADFNQYYRGAASIAANGNVSDPKLATATMASAPYSATAPGERENIAQRDRAAHEATTRAAATQEAIAARANEQRQWEDQHSLVDLTSPDGLHTIKVPKSEVPNYQAKGYGVAQSLDQRKSALLGSYMQPGIRPDSTQPVNPQPAPDAPPAAPTSTPGSPFGGMPNDVRAVVGLPHLTAEEERAHALDEQARTSIPDLPAPPAEFSQAARDAEAGGGAVAAAKAIAGHTMNVVTGHDFFPGQTAELQRLSNLAARTRALPISGVSRDSVQREKWNNENIPQPNTMFGTVAAGGDVAKTKAMQLAVRLRQDYETTAALARAASTPPAERAKMIAHLNELRSVIAEWEKPVQSEAPAVPGAQPAAPATPSADPMEGRTATGPNGQKVIRRNGQWVPM